MNEKQVYYSLPPLVRRRLAQRLVYILKASVQRQNQEQGDDDGQIGAQTVVKQGSQQSRSPEGDRAGLALDDRSD
ncbi:MAG: hypothetical protein OXB95_04095 [Rhodobacteraceae bacterium]|nr:hypothetical protein [Paracoccaceae bacterium]